MPDSMLEEEKEGFTFSGKFLALMLLGVAIVFIGIIVMTVALSVWGDGSASAGAVIFIGPIPIVFGAGPDATWLIIIGIILAVLNIAVFLIMNRKKR